MTKILKRSNSKINGNLLKNTDSSDRYIKGTDLLQVPEVYEYIKLYAETSDHETMKEIGNELKADIDYQAALQKAFPDKKLDKLASSVIKQYFYQKYNTENNIANYFAFGVDENGNEIKSKVQAIVDSAEISKGKEGNPQRDARILKNSLAPSDPNEIMTDVLKEQLKKLSIQPNAEEHTAPLKEAFINFHTEVLNLKANLPDYSKRLGKYYNQVGKILGDTNKALVFIRDNFDLLIQPPQVQLPNGQPYTKPDHTDASVAVSAYAVGTDGVVITSAKDMAVCFQRGENYHAKYPEALKNTDVDQDNKSENNADNQEENKEENNTSNNAPSQKADTNSAPAGDNKDADNTKANEPAPKKAAEKKADNTTPAPAPQKAADTKATAKENAFDISTLTTDTANAFDNTVQNLGGIDQALILLQAMKDQQLTAAGIVQKQEEKIQEEKRQEEKRQAQLQVDKIAEMADNFTPEMLESLVAKLLSNQKLNH